MNERLVASADAELVDSKQLSEHYIEAQTSLVERELRTLKHDDAFAILDSYGDVGTFGETPEGLFFRDTRYLSLFEMRIEGQRPLLLSSVIQDDNVSLTVDLTNPDINGPDGLELPRDLISISRTKLIWNAACHERIGLRNYDDTARTVRIELRFDADFRDLFEVRGSRRPRRGQRSVRIAGEDGVDFDYTGLDGRRRHTRLRFAPAPRRLEANVAIFDIRLEPDERRSIMVAVSCSEGDAPPPSGFMTAYRDARRSLRARTRAIATVESDNSIFNEVVCRSASDIYMLVSQTGEGLYPYAGTPWFSTVFGRDGIITAMMLLWVDPALAKGVLRYLANNQADRIDPANDAQPGKILHERRHGEMAILGEVPFRRYYGTVDATPLFVMLAGMYLQRSGDLETLREIWPNIKAALKWCDVYGDRDRDGFVEYYRDTPEGLANQGWKDSQDSVFHADGSDALGPIALCEVQGYVYAAKIGAAEIGRRLGHTGTADRLKGEAEALRVRFEEAFWCEEIGTYALALDGEKRPCRVRSSNAGHALFTGIADPKRAVRVAETLLSRDAFCGWGIRTIAQGEPRYNPMSYHNGSVWPHDNTLIAMGFARYGLRQEAVRVFSAIYNAASHQELRRLPELFCGFVRRPRRGPTAYPVACAPQAWAAAAPFALVEAALGLDLDCDRNEITFREPMLPDFMDEVILRGLRLGSSRVDVRLQRAGADVTVSILARQGDARVTSSK